MKNAGRSRFVASQGNLPVALYPSDQFPTIASIPTGAVVYDTTDGVVKRKVGSYLVDIQYNVIGYGPIADAPVAGWYWNQGRIGDLFLNTDDDELYVSVRAFVNSGVDYGDWGRPAGVIANTNPDQSFTIRVVVKATTSTVGHVFSLNGGGSYNQWGILQNFSRFNGYLGDASGYSFVSDGSDIFDIALVSNGTTHMLTANGVSGAPVANGAQTFAGNIYLGGRSDGVSANWEGLTFLAEIKNASNQCLACFNANSPTQWDGGATAVDSAGNPILFADSAPLGRVEYSWVKLSDAQTWGVLL